ncbi:MAG: hypothetical protein AB1847_11390 [bacterium]
MSTESSVLRLSFEAAEDLSNYQYHFVVLDPASGKIRLPDSSNEVALGILQDAPASGQAGSVMLLGKSKLVANASLGLGTFVKPEYVSASDAGKGQNADANWKYARGRVLEAAGAEGDICSVELIGPFPRGVDLFIGRTSVSSINTADVATYTASQLLGGLILRDPNGSSRSDLTPTGAQIAAALMDAGCGSTIAGLSFEFIIRNTADAAETITVTAGSGVTLSGTMTIAQNNCRRFLCVMNDASNATIYSLGTMVY